MNPTITLSSGQRISGSDPNYSEYAGQSGTTGQAQPNITRQVTPSMSLADAQNQANSAFSGLVSPMSLVDIRAREAEQKATSAKAAADQFNPQIAQEQKTGMATVSTAEGVTGQNQGFNISTAEAAFLAGTQQEVNGRVKYVEDQKASAIATGDLNAIQRADDSLAKLNDYNNQLTMAKANYALQLMSGSREQAQLELATSSQALQAKQAEQTANLQAETLKLNAYELANQVGVGNKFTVNGVEYIGLKDATGIDPANISLSTDDKGFETGINKLTGEVIWKSKVATGKTKTQAANVTLNLNAAQSAGLNSAVTALNNTIGANGFYSTSDVISQLQVYSIANPGKAQQFLDTVLPKVNPADIPTITGAIQKKTPQQEALDLINGLN